MVLLKQEWKMNLKSLLIWSICVGLSCCGCILLFDSVSESMSVMAESFAGMGSFSTAFGMDRVSIATTEGFYAAEISIIFSLGGAMFAAMTGAALLSKEEEGHTAEFLHTLPLGRGKIVAGKYATLLVLILAFNLICVLFELIGFVVIGNEMAWDKYALYHALSLLMQMETGSICFLISACTRRKQIGLALGISVFLYLADIMCRVVPDLKWMKWLTPYYYANAADLFGGAGAESGCVLFGTALLVLTAGVAGIVYQKRDLSA